MMSWTGFCLAKGRDQWCSKANIVMFFDFHKIWVIS